MVQENAKSVEHRKYLEDIKVYLKENPGFLLNINKGSFCLDKDDYFDIAKYYVDLYPENILDIDIHKLSGNHYYKVCKVMAQHGVLGSVCFGKIKLECPEQANNFCYDIMLTAITNAIRVNNILKVQSCFVHNLGQEYVTKADWAYLKLFAYFTCSFSSQIYKHDIINFMKSGLINEGEISRVQKKISDIIAIISDLQVLNGISLSITNKTETIPQIKTARYEICANILNRIKELEQIKPACHGKSGIIR